MTKQEWRIKAEKVKSADIKDIIEGLLSHEALRNPMIPKKRQIVIPWDEVEVYLVGLVEIDGELDRAREAGSLSTGVSKG
jgi:hypothetical protein